MVRHHIDMEVYAGAIAAIADTQRGTSQLKLGSMIMLPEPALFRFFWRIVHFRVTVQINPNWQSWHQVGIWMLLS